MSNDPFDPKLPVPDRPGAMPSELVNALQELHDTRQASLKIGQSLNQLSEQRGVPTPQKHPKGREV